MASTSSPTAPRRPASPPAATAPAIRCKASSSRPARQSARPAASPQAIHAASAGNPAASATHTLSGDNPTTAGDHTFTCATSQTQTCILSKDTTWFLVLSGTSASYSDGYYVWQMTDSDSQTNTPSTAGWTIADSAKYQRNNAWKDESGFSGLFKVLAEENPLLASGSVTTTEATLTLNHYTGAWWYQRTTPTGDDTCHSVAAGTTTASLSGLTHSTSYTYTTYSAANCNSADEITTATFTTAALGDRDSSKDISNSSSGLSDIWSDGTTVWAAWYIWSLQYGGVLAYDLSTGNRDTSKEFDSRAGNSDSKPFSLWGNASTFYVGDYDDKKIYAYNRSTKARDTSKEFNFHADNAGPWGMWSDGTTLWVSDSSDKKLYAYKLSDGTREAAKDYDTMFSAAGNDAVEGLWSERRDAVDIGLQRWEGVRVQGIRQVARHDQGLRAGRGEHPSDRHLVGRRDDVCRGCK